MRAWLPLLSGLVLLPASAAGQARVESIIPEDARIVVQPLGADRAVRLELGMELMPGDLVSASVDSVFVELACGAGDETNHYMISSPFRVLIDVPAVASCHVNMLAGLTEVAAEAPTETSAGGVTLGSTGTQYAVEVRRDGGGIVLNCIVYDDTVRVLSWSGMEAVAGSKLVWSADRRVELTRNTTADLARSAATYARFDLAAAGGANAVPYPAEALRQLTSLHYEVLANPADTTKRVDLAKEQIKYKASDHAAYNLKRVDIRSDTALRRYEIDPSVIGEARLRPDVRELRVSPELRAAIVTEARVSTTDSDLRLVEAGRVAEAIENLEARVRGGNATSRDHYALARAYARQGEQARVRSNAGRALVLHASDDRLSAAELRELGQLIARQD